MSARLPERRAAAPQGRETGAMQVEFAAMATPSTPTTSPQGAGLLRVLSMGFLADEEQAIMWLSLIHI